MEQQIDLGPAEIVAGFAYVALERVSKMSELILEPTKLEKLILIK